MGACLAYKQGVEAEVLLAGGSVSSWAPWGCHCGALVGGLPSFDGPDLHVDGIGGGLGHTDDRISESVAVVPCAAYIPYSVEDFGGQSGPDSENRANSDTAGGQWVGDSMWTRKMGLEIGVGNVRRGLPLHRISNVTWRLQGRGHGVAEIYRLSPYSESR